MKFALLLLLAASGTVVLTDDVYQVAPGQWRWVRFEIRHRPATADCRFDVSGGGEIRAELVSRPDLELFRQHKIHDTLAETDSGHSGAFSQYIQDPGEYAVIIENTGSRAVAAHLTVSLSFGGPAQTSRYLSPGRRLTVILISCIAFFAIVTFSARALLRALNRT